jgi:DNA repair protein SbcC/Rad50
MIVEELRLRHWRGYRDQRTFRFAPGLNLVVGPNEAGKSTIFEALSRALFDRHTSRAAELERVRPLGSSLGPEVQLVLRAGDCRYRVVKRFLESPSSQLFVERAGSFELDHEGDRADAELRRLLGGEAARGAARPDQRGLAQALWYLQRDDSLPARAWSQALHEGLAGLMKLSLQTPEQESVLLAIAEEHAETFTRTGRLRKGSELGVLRADRERLTLELSARQEELERTRAHREELGGLAARAEDTALRRGEALERLERLDRQLERAPEVEARHRVALEVLGDAERRAAGVRTLRERLRRLERRIAEAEAARVAAIEEEQRLRTAARDLRRAAETHARRWEEDLAPKLQAARSQIEDLRARLRVEQLEREESSLLAKRERRSQLQAEAAAVEEQLRELAAPDSDESERLDALAERARALTQRVRAAAVRVKVELEPATDIEISPELQRDPESGEYLVAGPSRFRIPGVVEVMVRAADASLETWHREASAAEADIRAALERYGVDDLAALAERRRAARRLEARLAAIRSRWLEAGGSVVAGAGPSADQVEAEEREAQLLADLHAELRDLRARAPQAVLPGIEGWAEHRTQEQIRALEERTRALERSLREARDAEQAADRSYRQRHDDLLRLGQRAAGASAEAATLGAALAEELEPYGDLPGLEAAHAEAERELERLRGELRVRADELEQEVAQVRRARASTEAELRVLDGELRTVEAARADRLARIEEAAALDLDGRVDDLAGRLGVVERRLEVVERRASAARLLQRLVEHHQDRRARELVKPVAELVDRWLGHVTGRRYQGLSLDDKLVPLEVRPARYQGPLPLESLSYGTYEQVVVLLRLALAALLSREERHLVILDDRLVNADASRLERLCEVLAEVASSCQILIATCDEAPFRKLGARVIRVAGEETAEAAETAETAEDVGALAGHPDPGLV